MRINYTTILKYRTVFFTDCIEIEIEIQKMI